MPFHLFKLVRGYPMKALSGVLWDIADAEDVTVGTEELVQPVG